MKTVCLPLGFKLGHRMNDTEYFSYSSKKIITSKLSSIFLTTITFALLLFSVEHAFAVTTITWGAASYTPLHDDAFGNIGIPITFTVDDTDLAGNMVIDTINVLLTSTSGDSTTLTLVEDGADNGMFTNTKLIFMYENAEFGIADTGTITIFDDCSITGVGNCDPNAVETLIGGSGFGAFVGSNSEPGGIGIDLIETGPNTSLFTTTLKFSTMASNPLSSTLLVSEGDTITILDEFTSAWVNGLIVPPPTDDIGAIQVVEFGTVIASYNGVSEQVGVDPSPFPGRGGGGAIRPGLVLNFIATVSGTVLCNGDCVKPTLGLDYNSRRIVENGFSYNGNPVDVDTFYTPYPLITVNVGQKNSAVLKIYENSGPQKISHVDLAFGLSKGKSISESKAVIIWARNVAGIETVTVKDPENALQDVSVVTENGPCTKNNSAQCLILTIFHTFRQPLEFNMVGTNVWDIARNAQQNYFNHGIEIVGKSLNPPPQILLLDNRGYPAVITLTDKDNAIDENGNSWYWNGEFWIKDENHLTRLDKPIGMHGINRDNNMFSSYKKGQEILAKDTLQKLVIGKVIQNFDFGKNKNKQIIWNWDEEKYNLFLQQKIKDEIIRAEILFEKLFDIKHNH